MKNWITTAVAIIAVVVSVCALCLDYKHTEDALQSQQASDARHDEQFATAMSKAGEANELAREANGFAGEANDLAKEVLATDQQHAEHAELSNHLLMLHIRLNDQLEWLNEIPYDARVATAAGRPFHVEATNNWCEAEKELLDGNFDLVRELIKVAHDNIGKCYSAAEEEIGRLPLPPLPPKPVWIGEEEETY